MAELKALELDPCSDLELEPDKRNDKAKHMIDVDPNTTITTTKVKKNEPNDWEEGKRLFQSQMCVKGFLLQFIVDSGS